MKKTRRRKTTKPQPESLEWLLEQDRKGTRRIEKLSWTRLARIYYRRKATREIRTAIELEARRLGYAPQTILRRHRP